MHYWPQSSSPEDPKQSPFGSSLHCSGVNVGYVWVQTQATSRREARHTEWVEVSDPHPSTVQEHRKLGTSATQTK